MPVKTLTDKAGNSFQLLEVDGTLFPVVFNEETLLNIPRLKVHDDDIFICGHARSGTHLTFEIVHMLLTQTAKLSKSDKEAMTLEMQPEDVLSGLPSPRILNTHVLYPQLPKEVRQKKTKIIYVLRNPRDVIVSRFILSKQLSPAGTYIRDWDNYFQASVDGSVEWGSWFNDVLSWERDIQENGDHPVLIVRYEDTLSDPRSQIQKISGFLGIPCDDQLIQNIAESSDFKSMKKGKTTDGCTIMVDDEAVHYRKGIAGDWRNWFTVAQSENFDAVYRQKMINSKFREYYE